MRRWATRSTAAHQALMRHSETFGEPGTPADHRHPATLTHSSMQPEERSFASTPTVPTVRCGPRFSPRQGLLKPRHTYPVPSARIWGVVRPDFPRSIIEFQRWFPDDQACRDYLINSRWSEGFRCPRCDEQVAVLLAKRLLWQCSACR